jgi:histone H3/H4
VAAPTRRIAVNQPEVSSSTTKLPLDVLVVVSKVKDYIKAKADMNTSDSVKDLLSEKVRQLCDDAIDKARSEGRKTVMDRDF